MISYKSPTFAGATLYAQYSMGKTTSEDKAVEGAVENESSADRYYAIGATYANGPFLGYLAVDSTNYKSTGENYGVDDSLTVTLGGNYDFEVAKVFFGAQYFDEVELNSIGVVMGKLRPQDKTKIKGFGVGLSASAPLAGGTGIFGVAYVDAKQASSEPEGADFDFTRWVVSAGYDYPFSKRTDAYAVASYMNDKMEDKGEGADSKWKPSAYTFMVGLRHKF